MSCENYKDNALWLERFEGLMEILEEMDFLSILEEDENEETHEVDESECNTLCNL